jgi:hypothetical protein
MRVSFSYSLKQFFSPEAFLPFLVGAICLAVVGNEITDVLNKLFGDPIKVMLSIAFSALLVLLFCAWGFKQWVSRLAQPPAEFKQRPPEFKRGLILLVSKPETCSKAIEYHLPILERCWLLCSLQSLQVAENLRNEFSAQVKMPDPVIINDVNSPLEFADRVNEIYAHLPEGWRDNDVIADYTGMTAHGSVGMALACLAPARPLQYTPGRYDAGLQAVAPLDPIEITLWRDGQSVAGS